MTGHSSRTLCMNSLLAASFLKLVVASAIVSSMLFGCVSTQPTASKGDSFLIVDAKSLDRPSPPRRVAVQKGPRIVHIPTGGGVAAIEPGLWELAHFDYMELADFKDINSPQIPILSISVDERLELELEAGKIYYFGMLKLSEGKNGLGSFEISGDLELLRQACETRPELFEKYPLVLMFPKSEKEVLKVDCDNYASTKTGK